MASHLLNCFRQLYSQQVFFHDYAVIFILQPRTFKDFPVFLSCLSLRHSLVSFYFKYIWYIIRNSFVHSYAMKWSLHLSLTWNLRKRCSVVLWLKHKLILECCTWCSTSARDHNRQKQTCNKLKAKTAHLLFCWFKNILECKDMFLIKHFILNSWKNRCILGS